MCRHEKSILPDILLANEKQICDTCGANSRDCPLSGADTHSIPGTTHGVNSGWSKFDTPVKHPGGWRTEAGDEIIMWPAGGRCAGAAPRATRLAAIFATHTPNQMKYACATVAAQNVVRPFVRTVACTKRRRALRWMNSFILQQPANKIAIFVLRAVLSNYDTRVNKFPAGANKWICSRSDVINYCVLSLPEIKNGVWVGTIGLNAPGGALLKISADALDSLAELRRGRPWEWAPALRLIAIRGRQIETETSHIPRVLSLTSPEQIFEKVQLRVNLSAMLDLRQRWSHAIYSLSGSFMFDCHLNKNTH